MPRYPFLVFLVLLSTPALFAQTESDATAADAGSEADAQPGISDRLPEDGVALGGVGRFACAQITGVDNFVYLGQAADWALGYMAGRLDAGQTIAADATISPADSIDLVTGIATRCAETPEAAVIDAVRDIALKIYGEDAAGGEVAADPLPPEPVMPEPKPPAGSVAPPPRPEQLAASAASTE